MNLKGWIELDGVRLSPADVERMLKAGPEPLTRCGGEFLLTWDGCTARDAFGIMPGPVPPGVVCCGGRAVARIAPDPPSCTLEEAIITAVDLRSDEGVVAFSGGVDSGLIAGLADLPCVAVGIEGSHDIIWATKAALMMELDLEVVTPTEEEVAEALARVVRVIPDPANPVEASIATTLFFVAARARELGHTRILAGQGADELFGGYARYLSSPDLAAELERDVADHERQRARDQAVATLHGTCSRCPTSTSGWCAPHRRSRPVRRCAGGAKTPSGRSQNVISPLKSPGPRRKRCSTGAGSGGQYRGSHAGTAIDGLPSTWKHYYE